MTHSVLKARCSCIFQLNEFCDCEIYLEPFVSTSNLNKTQLLKSSIVQIVVWISIYKLKWVIMTFLYFLFFFLFFYIESWWNLQHQL